MVSLIAREKSKILFVADNARLSARIKERVTGRYVLLGVWCSGITCASHAQGPGFEPRHLHYLFFLKSINLVVVNTLIDGLLVS